MNPRITILATLVGALSLTANADDKPAPEPYANDFQAAKVGELPDGMLEIDGTFLVAEGEGGARYLEMAAEPLSENAVIFGASVKGAAMVEAKAISFKKRRSYPRFGVGLHGISGFRLRVVPSKKAIELVKSEEPVATVKFDWKADAWMNLELVVKPAGEKWSVEGRAWADGEERPEAATISMEHEGSPGQGKASVWGTAYSGKVVRFDDLKVTPGS